MVEHGYAVSPDIAHREIEGQLLLLLPDDSYLYTLNASGQLIWKGLMQGRPPADLVQEICTTFGIGERQAEKDVNLFISQLKRKRILVTRPA
ncbi:PqqD family protein [bacterium]|nr:PqqD family protein [bacterium]